MDGILKMVMSGMRHEIEAVKEFFHERKCPPEAHEYQRFL
jgi:hypothetical protein